MLYLALVKTLPYVMYGSAQAQRRTRSQAQLARDLKNC